MRSLIPAYLLAGALALCSSSLPVMAQSAKPAEPAATPAAPAQTPATSPAEAPAAAPAAAATTPVEKPDIVAQPWRRAECEWTGQRIMSLLWRDDVNTAREQNRFYEMFGCPAAHLPVAFRCVIEESESKPDQNDLNARVYSCWTNPEKRTAQE
jgi:hypothetical protein